MILIKPWELASIEACPIRQIVFVLEQGVPEAMELDELDSSAAHALAYSNAQCVGTARLVTLNPTRCQIGRMAVLGNYRKQGIGSQLLGALIEYGREQGMTEYFLHAQLVAIPFYEQWGFVAQGKVYDEAGIPHRNMILLI